ncbi:MAG: homocysteine S-methyltransferase [Thermoanaerobaculia bacterium]
MSPTGIVHEIVAEQGVLILDGGLATELEAQGCDLNNDLWSARVLIEEPEKIKRVHLDYLVAGSDCIVTSSYQATVQGFVQSGLSSKEARDLLLRSVDLGIEAREEFRHRRRNRRGRVRPLIAASIGPYGAYLADGSEFRGDYDLTVDDLYDFHRPRWEILASSDADLLACETIPSGPEAEALGRLIEETPEREVWISFTCPTVSAISDGTDLRSVAADLAQLENIAAIGVNCTAPKLIPELVKVLSEASDKPIVVCPNSGEIWHQESRQWLPGDPQLDLAAKAVRWRELGARLIGGCCRTNPKYIRRLRSMLGVEARQVVEARLD